jgi:hypothetical protein
MFAMREGICYNKVKENCLEEAIHLNYTNTGSKVLNLVNKIGTFILMNLMFLIGCIPVVTIGASWSGLYSAVRFTIRGESWFAGYKEGFKTGLLRNILATSFGLVVGYYALDNLLPAIAMVVDGVEVTVATVIIVAFGVLLLAVLLFLAIMVPVNLYIRTDYDRWLKSTFYLIGHAPVQCLVTTALVWFPVYQMIFPTWDFIFFAIPYVAGYFIVVCWVITMLLKTPLILLKDREREAETLLDED